MFSIVTTFIENGQIDKTLEDWTISEKNFNQDIGVVFRKHFQCEYQPHVIWSFTEWVSEKHHNDAAQSIMKIRRDDRISSIAFSPEPYFEIFCEENQNFRLGEFSDDFQFILVAHGIISKKVKDQYEELTTIRFEEVKNRIPWLRVFYNTYNPDEFVIFMGFNNKEEFEKRRDFNGLHIEEYLFTGLRTALGMSYIAGYNQFICKPLDI